jgi:hypothetical protein
MISNYYTQKINNMSLSIAEETVNINWKMSHFFGILLFFIYTKNKKQKNYFYLLN